MGQKDNTQASMSKIVNTMTNVLIRRVRKHGTE